MLPALYLFVAASFSYLFKTHAESIDLTGTMTINVYGRSKSDHERWSFSAQRDSNEQWLIALQNLDDVSDSGAKAPRNTITINSFEVGLSGTNIYRKTIWNPPPGIDLPKGVKSSNYLGFAAHNVEIGPNGIPAFDSTRYFPIWLAFMSEPFLSSREGVLIPSIINMRTDFCTVHRPSIRFALKASGKPPFRFPSEIAFFNAGQYEKIQALPKDLRKNELLLKPFPRPFNQGFKEASYRALSWGTNGVNLVYPMTAVYQWFVPMQNGATTNDLDLLVEARIRVDMAVVKVKENSATTANSKPVTRVL